MEAKESSKCSGFFCVFVWVLMFVGFFRYSCAAIRVSSVTCNKCLGSDSWDCIFCQEWENEDTVFLVLLSFSSREAEEAGDSAVIQLCYTQAWWLAVRWSSYNVECCTDAW